MTPGSIAPGPGEPAERPTISPTAKVHRGLFVEPVDAWVAEGADGWWRIPLVDIPRPAGSGSKNDPERRRALTRVRNAWMREIRRRVEAGQIAGSYVSLTRVAEGQEWFYWGPAAPGDEAGDSEAPDIDTEE